MSEWKPIETAPRDGTDIYVCYKNCDTWFFHRAFWIDGDEDAGDQGWWSYTITEVSRTLLDGACEPTHWKSELPEPPK